MGTTASSEAMGFRARQPALDTPYRAAEAAAAALAAGAVIARNLGGSSAPLSLESRHAEASLLSFAFLRFQDPDKAIGPRIAGEERTAVAGFYPTKDDRYIYLHPGFPHNTQGLLELLQVPDNASKVRRAIRRWQAAELEAAIAEAGLCGAMARSASEWDTSAAGRRLAATPVVEIIQVGDSPPEPLPITDPARPLAGSRVLDLTRILAGPTCARTLAAYGADALRVGAPGLPHVPLFAVDTGFGKRACHLNLKRREHKAQLTRLLKQTDVFSQGYRSGALDRLGFGVADAVAARPGLVYVSINCYGHEGEWRPRPGWEQLAQTVTGMAVRQGRYQKRESPTLLPAAVNDYTTGYLAALGALAALERRARTGGSYWVRVSLARTGMWVRSLGERDRFKARPPEEKEIEAYSARMDSAWGPLSYLRPALEAEGLDIGWKRPPSPLGADKARFLKRSSR